MLLFRIPYGALADCTALTIYGYSGSSAETCAEAHNIPFVALDESTATDTDTAGETDTDTAAETADTATETDTDTSTDTESPKDEVYTYYFLAPYDWFDIDKGAYNSDVGAYYWYKDSAPVEWPGLKMTPAPEVGENVFKAEIPADAPNIIFNAFFNVGRNSTEDEIFYAHQTDDLSTAGYALGECPYDKNLVTDNFNGWICVCDCYDEHDNPVNVGYCTGSAWFKLDDYKNHSDYYGTYGLGNGSAPSLIVFGDLDGDGSITSSDALMILRQSVMLEEFTPEQTAAADIDGDGSITAADALAVLRYSVGLAEADSKVGDFIK